MDGWWVGGRMVDGWWEGKKKDGEWTGGHTVDDQVVCVYEWMALWWIKKNEQ